MLVSVGVSLGPVFWRRIFQSFAKRDKRLAANRRAEEYQRTAKNILTRYVFSLEIHASQLLFIQCLTSGLRQGIPRLFLFPIEITSCHLKSWKGEQVSVWDRRRGVCVLGCSVMSDSF